MGPPQRSPREVVLAIETASGLSNCVPPDFRDHSAKAWFCLSRRRF
jgi:hypothetical protein